MQRRLTLPCMLIALCIVISACVGAPNPKPQTRGEQTGYPQTISSCGFTSTVPAPPQRAITLNQGATEVMLALGLQHSIIGTAYLDDAIAPQWEAAYRSIPVLAKEYPSREQVLADHPDFLYASYSSAFDAKNVGTQHYFASQHIASYLSPFACLRPTSNDPISWKQAWHELEVIGTVFGVPDRTQKLVAQQQQIIETLHRQSPGKNRRAVWFDSDTKSPFVGGGSGGPALIMKTVGLSNVFGDLDQGWANTQWEKIIDANPDIIVVADASWSTAQSKIDFLRSDPVLKNLRAVRNNHLVTVPFSETTPGVRLADGAANIAEALTKIHG